jgi:biotin carboxyl carrier protein
VLCIVEGMKMEYGCAPTGAGPSPSFPAAPGQPVKTGRVICVVSAG